MRVRLPTFLLCRGAAEKARSKPPPGPRTRQRAPSRGAAGKRPDRSIGRWSDATARAVARKPARFLEEVDERMNGGGKLALTQVHDVPVAADWKTTPRELDEPSARKLERAGVAGDHGEAEPRLDRVLDGAVGAELHRHLQLRAGLARRLLQRPAAAGRGLA